MKNRQPRTAHLLNISMLINLGWWGRRIKNLFCFCGKLSFISWDLPVVLDENPPESCSLVQTSHVKQGSSFWNALKGGERSSEDKHCLCPLKWSLAPENSYEPPPTNLHHWQWRVTVTQKQVANKQRLENASPSLCLSSGNPLFHTPLSHTSRTHTAALYSSTVIVSAVTQTFPDAATTSLVSDIDLIHGSLMQGAEVYKKQLQK